LLKEIIAAYCTKQILYMYAVGTMDSFIVLMKVVSSALTFRNRASYIQDGHTATLQTPHFKYFFNKYMY
jgi:hypothetical protein